MGRDTMPRADGLAPLLSCPICGSVRVSVFMELMQVPVHANMLWQRRELALTAPLGDMRLGFCADCGHIYNYAYDHELVAYTETYENSLHYSPHFQRYATSLAAYLVERYDLHGRSVLEIGSGQGDFLRLLCELGHNQGVGFDPSYVPTKDDITPGLGVTFIRDLYSERYADLQADLVCCRHVLEHLASPMGLLGLLRRTFGSQPATALYFEVPNALSTLQDQAIWDIIYEHCSYFSPLSLSCAFDLAGFQVTSLRQVYERQFLAVEALPADGSAECSFLAGEGTEPLALAVAGFSAQYRSKVEAWRRSLKQLAHDGQRAVVWGAGSKGVTFLNTFKTESLFEYIVDVNPRKTGGYVAGSGECIVLPEFLRFYQPDVVIIMNAIYLQEIRSAVAELGLAPQFLTA